MAERHRRYNEEHREELTEYMRWYREEHKEEQAEHDRRYREEHKEEIRERHRQYCRKTVARKRRFVHLYLLFVWGGSAITGCLDDDLISWHAPNGHKERRISEFMRRPGPLETIKPALIEELKICVPLRRDVHQMLTALQWGKGLPVTWEDMRRLDWPELLEEWKGDGHD